MAIDEQSLRRMVEGFSLVKSCDSVENGMLRVATPFQYSDGSQVDLFIENELLPEKDVILSDMGQTVAYLLDLHVRPWTSKRRELAVVDICQSLGVHKEGGQILTRVPSLESTAVTDAIVRLSQACIRVADLALTQRWRMVSAFRDEVEEFIDSVDVNYETPFTLPGRYDREVDLDFKVIGRQTKSLILTLSTQNAAAGHGLCNEVFRKWYDIHDHQQGFQFITTFDSTNDVFRQDDLNRIQDLSTLFGFPAQADGLAEALAA